ncbi:MAG: hypothetical protein M1839_007077 [Geoglossum umbratile]|nr:MAG: hypothetical protein M1839_007077 [Geoglossum umbratile]
MSTSQYSSAVALPPPIPLSQNTAPVGEFKCLYTHDKRQKKKRWHDGWLRFHTFNKRVMVYDDTRNFIGDMHYTDSGEICEGDDLTFEAFLVQVLECTKTVQQDLTPLFAPGLRRREAIQQQTSARAERSLATQSPLPQSQGPLTTTAPQTPLSQLRPKSLNALLGTAKRPHGRALLPTRSPFEERQKEGDGTRAGGPPSKRSATTTENGDNDMDSLIVLAAPEQIDQVELCEERLCRRTAGRSQQQDRDKKVSCEMPPQASHRSKEIPREPQLRGPRLLTASSSVLQQAKQRTRSPAISIESDSEPIPMETPYKPAHSRGQGDPTNPAAYKQKVPPLAGKYPPQPLRILATSSRKKKLLCQEAPGKPSGGERDSRIHLHRQQQEILQERRQDQYPTQTSIDRNHVLEPEEIRDFSYWTSNTPQRGNRGGQTSLRSSPQIRREDRGRVERESALPEQGRKDLPVLAAGKVTSARVTTGPSAGESRPNSRGAPGQSVRSRREQKRRLPEQDNSPRPPNLRTPKSARAPTTSGGSRSTVMEEGVDGPWSEESADLFNWHPTSKGGKGARC